MTHHPKRANYGPRLLPRPKGLALSDILSGLTHCPGMTLKDALGEPSASVAPLQVKVLSRLGAQTRLAQGGMR